MKNKRLKEQNNKGVWTNTIYITKQIKLGEIMCKMPLKDNVEMSIILKYAHSTMEPESDRSDFVRLPKLLLEEPV